jgi:hypothetical protein
LNYSFNPHRWQVTLKIPIDGLNLFAQVEAIGYYGGSIVTSISITSLPKSVIDALNRIGLTSFLLVLICEMQSRYSKKK